LRRAARSVFAPATIRDRLWVSPATAKQPNTRARRSRRKLVS
jgi:hypothetical protein